MTITTYLFDFDDTIIDTKIYAEIYYNVLEMIKEKLNLDDKELEEKAKKLGFKKNKFKRWDTGDFCRELGLLDDYYMVLEDKIKIMPVLHDNIVDLLTKLKEEEKQIGIVSNSMMRTIKLYLKKYELIELIDFVFSFDDAKCLKRNDNYWKTLIEKHNLEPRKCLVISDDINDDVKMPKQFGFHTFLIKDSKDLKNLA
ncbi:MAG: HAD family hydrolase [archaeon]